MMSSNTSPISISTTTTTNSNSNSSTNSNTKNNNNNISRIGNGGTTPACAACKYQRRKCAPDCILAPYFPHDRQRQFLNVHKLFGVRKITKIIENLATQAHKDEAMRSIIFQSDVRANDLVGGCYRIVLELQRQINYAQAELDLLLHHLAIYQQQQHHQNQHQQQDQTTIETNIDSAMMAAVGCMDVYTDPMFLQFHCSLQQQPQQQSDHEEQQHHHHHHHHHHHQNQQQQHHQLHGYAVEDTLQDGDSVNSWGMAAGG